MGKCKCGARPPVIQPEEKIQNELILDNRHKIHHIKKHINHSRRENNLLLYLLVGSIFVIILLVYLGRKCDIST